MKILFTTNKKMAASTVLNLKNMERLNRINGIEFKSYKDDYENYDVILLMGYDFDIENIRKKKSKSIDWRH